MRRFFLFSSFLFVLGCVTPPNIQQSQVLPERELKLVATIKQGTDYAQGGRADLAEIQFRKALLLNPKLSNVYNDLGFALQSQDRLDEATAMYRKALQLEKYNVVAQENLARVEYLQGDIEQSIRDFEQVLTALDLLPPSVIHEATGQDYKPADMQSIYRNLASAYYRQGEYDEAICYSRKTLDFAGIDFSVIGQHDRLLLSLEMVEDAVKLLNGAITALLENTPSKLLLDYGIALYANGDQQLAQEALSRGLTAKDIAEEDRRTFHVLQLLIQVNGDSPERQQKSIQDFLDEDEEFCQAYVVDEDHYWPLKVTDDVVTLVKRLCPDEK
jgi:Flp pilus assembly protein TadD